MRPPWSHGIGGEDLTTDAFGHPVKHASTAFTVASVKMPQALVGAAAAAASSSSSSSSKNPLQTLAARGEELRVDTLQVDLGARAQDSEPVASQRELASILRRYPAPGSQINDIQMGIFAHHGGVNPYPGGSAVFAPNLPFSASAAAPAAEAAAADVGPGHVFSPLSLRDLPFASSSAGFRLQVVDSDLLSGAATVSWAVQPNAPAGGSGKGGASSPSSAGGQRFASGVVVLPPGSLSLGSVDHGIGTCQPCFYVNTKIGCQYGSPCKYCHSEHPAKNQEVPSRQKRRTCQDFVDQFFEGCLPGGLTPLRIAEADLQRAPGFPHGDEVAGKYCLKLLRIRYKAMGIDLAAEGAGDEEGRDVRRI